MHSKKEVRRSDECQTCSVYKLLWAQRRPRESYRLWPHKRPPNNSHTPREKPPKRRTCHKNASRCRNKCTKRCPWHEKNTCKDCHHDLIAPATQNAWDVCVRPMRISQMLSPARKKKSITRPQRHESITPAPKQPDPSQLYVNKMLHLSRKTWSLATSQRNGINAILAVHGGRRRTAAGGGHVREKLASAGPDCRVEFQNIPKKRRFRNHLVPALLALAAPSDPVWRLRTQPSAYDWCSQRLLFLSQARYPHEGWTLWHPPPAQVAHVQYQCWGRIAVALSWQSREALYKEGAAPG